MSRKRAPGAWGWFGEATWMAGIVGLVSPWIPPDGKALTGAFQGMTLVWWYVGCVLLLGLGVLLTKRAEDGRWPCWLLLGHVYKGVDNGWIVCFRCGHGEKLEGWDPDRDPGFYDEKREWP